MIVIQNFNPYMESGTELGAELSVNSHWLISTVKFRIESRVSSGSSSEFLLFEVAVDVCDQGVRLDRTG